MSVTAPPRPPRQTGVIDRAELEALVEALIEEARQRARRRRRKQGAVVTLVALAGLALFTTFGRGAQSPDRASEPAARATPAAATATSKIAFIREPFSGGYAGVLWVMNPDGSGQRRLAPAHGGRWSPDGKRIAFASDGVYVMNADGSGQERLTSDPGWYSDVAWSPDGRQIAFTRFQSALFPGPEYWEIYVMNADGSGKRILRRIGPQIGDRVDLAWSPFADKIAFLSRRGGNLEIYVMNADGSEPRRLTRNTVGDTNPAWSPDGRKIAFQSNWQVWVMNADGSGQRRLTRNGGRNFAPVWSPDGRRIAFERRLGRIQSTSWCSGCGTARIFEIWVMNADGTGQQRLTPRGAKPAWSPDGRRIAFNTLRRHGNADVYSMNADGSGQRNLTRTPRWQESSAAWSPARSG